MPGIFEGKNVVLTGAAGGIGRAIAALLSEQGARLLLIDPNGEGLEAMSESLGNGPHWTATSQLESPEACRTALSSVDGPIYGLVHMAGIFEKHDLSPEAREVYDRTLAANLTNGFDLTTAALTRLVTDQPARLVFASSLAFRRGSLGRVAYSAAKGGVAGLIRGLARNLGPKALVNGIAPGVIETPMVREIKQERGESMVEEIPLGRLGRAEEVAGVVLFLLGPHASYITGQIINVDGGLINA